MKNKCESDSSIDELQQTQAYEGKAILRLRWCLVYLEEEAKKEFMLILARRFPQFPKERMDLQVTN